MNDRLYRSRDDRMLAGVAAGLADYWDADPSLIRVIWALLAILTGGIALVVYIVMAIVVPEGDDALHPMAPGTPTQAWSGTPGWTAPGAMPGWTPPAGPGTPPPGPGTAASDPTAAVPPVDASTGAAPGPAQAPGVAAPYPMPAGSWPSPASYPMDPRSARRAARAARRAARRERGGLGPLLVGLILILLGAFFLAREWIPQLDFDWFWPVILIAIGVVTLAAAFVRPRDDGSLR